ncbi:hypothetical protein QBE55_03105 [Eubacteriales bacterium mix99]|jgi:uncharacterized membrane protein
MGRGGASRGGGGSSGGGRSFGGGGGGRSFGGRSGSSGYNRGGSGGFNRGGSGNPFGGFGSSPHWNSSGMGPAFFGYEMGRRSGRRRRGPFFHRSGPGCLTVLIALIVAVVLITSLPGQSNNNNTDSFGQITASTVKREPLPKGAVTETGYYTDELDWIGNQTTLTAGLKNFYKKTGVQPYLYITDTIDGTHAPSDDQVEQFANSTYESLFSDEAHLLVIFFEYEDTYHTWYLAGSQAKTVLDQEAMDILLDYIDRYYYDQDLTDDQMFSKAFDKAGERIMSVMTSPWVPVLVVLGILAVLTVAFFWWRSYKKQKNKEAEDTEKILHTPLETFGSGEAEERAKKYDK